MRLAWICIVAATAVPGQLLPAQGAGSSASSSYTTASSARYLPLAMVRDGTVRMPDALMRLVSVHRQQVPLQQVLLDIATQAGLGLSYGEDLARSNTLVSMDIITQSAANALALAVHDTRWTVLVTPAGQVAVVSSAQVVLSSVGGRVMERASGAVLPGLRVNVEGTRLSATTNDSGGFRIPNLPPGDYTLIVNRVGYYRTSKPITVGDGALTVDLTVDPAPNLLDQIVVTGVPTATSRRTLGNAISMIDVTESAKKVVNNSVSEVLQAKVPGVSVMKTSGTPGAGAQIRIRGAGSMTGAVSPVIYVDGVRLYAGPGGNFRNSYEQPSAVLSRSGGGPDASALDAINPDDIESIEVIKGPAAATLYGAEAANGVVQIITKKGARGAQQRQQWTGKAQIGRSDWALDRRSNSTTCTSALIADVDGFPGCVGKPEGSILALTSLDQPGVLRAGNLHAHSLSLRGGGQDYSFLTRGESDLEEGVVPNSATQRNSARANVAVYPRDGLNVTTSIGVARTTTRFPMGGNGWNIMESAWTFRPGSALRTGAVNGFAGTAVTPAALASYDNELNVDRLTFGATMNLNPVEWLENRLTIGGDISSGRASRFIPPGSPFDPITGQITNGAPANSVYSVDYAGTIRSRLPWNDVGSALSFGVQYTNSRYQNTVVQGNNLLSPQSRDVELSITRNSWTEFSEVKSLGFYGQEQLTWNDRLYLTGALRVDNSSVFGDDIKQLTYPKLSAAYVLSDEPFTSAHWLDQLKVRAAWGQAGNAPDPFAGVKSYLLVKGVDPVTGAVVPSLRLFSKGNSGVRPERGTEIELGVDAALFRGRASIELTYYDKRTKDAIMAVPISPSEGYADPDRQSVVFQNLGEISNKGFEVALATGVYRSNSITWDTRLGISANANKLVRFGYRRQPILIGLTTPNQRHAEGYPLGGFWVHDPVLSANGNYVAGPARFVGSPSPTREAALENTIRLGANVRVSALLDYKGGYYVLNQTDWRRCTAGVCPEVNDPNVSDDEKRRLTVDLTVNDALYTQRADFIKLRDLSVAYAFPDGLAKRMKVSHASFTIAGHDLGFLWKPYYKGLDPEANFTGDNGPAGTNVPPFAFTAVDYWTMPMTRRITAALDFAF
ncbi:MAG: SusC/RagA family TonB-linked outer membrane protein [bacterium]